MRNRLVLLVAASLGLQVMFAQSGDLTVIGEKKSASAAVSSKELKSMLLGEKDHWAGGAKVVVVMTPLDSPATQEVLKSVCQMSEADFKRYFMQLQFQGKPSSPPKFLPNAAAIKAFVAATPGALGIVPAAQADASVTVVSVDGSAKLH